MTFALIIVCISVPIACSMRWLNLKKIAAERGKPGGNGQLEHEDKDMNIVEQSS